MNGFLWLCGLGMLMGGGALCASGEWPKAAAGVVVATIGACFAAKGQE